MTSYLEIPPGQVMVLKEWEYQPNYKEVLRKYILLVVEQEGVSFIKESYAESFTHTEWNILKEVEEELIKEQN